MLIGLDVDRIFKNISIFTTYVFWAVVWSLLQAYILLFFWNETVPSITVLFTPLTYKHAFSLIIIMRVLSRSWVKDTLQQAAANQLFATFELKQIVHNLFMLITAKINLDESRIRFFQAMSQEVPPENEAESHNNNNETKDL